MPVKYPRLAAGSAAEQVDTYIKREKHQVGLPKNLRKPSVIKTLEPVTEWFLIQAGAIVHRGTKKGCMDALVSYRRLKPKDTTEMFLAHGLKVI